MAHHTRTVAVVASCFTPLSAEYGKDHAASSLASFLKTIQLKQCFLHKTPTHHLFAIPQKTISLRRLLSVSVLHNTLPEIFPSVIFVNVFPYPHVYKSELKGDHKIKDNCFISQDCLLKVRLWPLVAHMGFTSSAVIDLLAIRPAGALQADGP